MHWVYKILASSDPWANKVTSFLRIDVSCVFNEVYVVHIRTVHESCYNVTDEYNWFVYLARMEQLMEPSCSLALMTAVKFCKFVIFYNKGSNGKMFNALSSL
ncbi:hypothetical protein CDL12_21471 [Handroanthus impetiginosus]|uniref:Uncharacterized protein n=1 Tax=Handroanthus impetiginosus TaxID=429701 RepID=A0A2G9GLA5_9LAMI|nr:hypothetical protein CDL12_21471 [Handroanthus impetiginosus]